MNNKWFNEDELNDDVYIKNRSSIRKSDERYNKSDAFIDITHARPVKLSLNSVTHAAGSVKTGSTPAALVKPQQDGVSDIYSATPENNKNIINYNNTTIGKINNYTVYEKNTNIDKLIDLLCNELEDIRINSQY